MRGDELAVEISCHCGVFLLLEEFRAWKLFRFLGGQVINVDLLLRLPAFVVDDVGLHIDLVTLF